MSYPCALSQRAHYQSSLSSCVVAYLDRFPPKDEEALRSLCQESCEFMDQNVFNLVRLLYPNAHTHAVHRRLNEYLLILVAGDSKRVEQNLRG